MKITVIMLTYNRENLIARAIESVLAQTFRDFEFIVIDNGSIDRSGQIADDYAQKDARIRVIHRNRGNIGSGRNAGLDAAGSEYITFVDDDDWCEPDFLQFLHALALENNVDAAICGTNYVHSDCKFIMSAEEAIITLMWRRHYTTGFPAKLFRRSLFANLRFAEEGRYDDIGLMYKILAEAEAEGVVYHGLPKYMVYRHDHNNSAPTAEDGHITADYLDSYRNTYRERRIWLSERFPGNAAYWRYFDWSFQISMLNKIISGNLTDCGEHLREIRGELAENRDEFIACPWIQDFEKEYVKKYLC